MAVSVKREDLTTEDKLDINKNLTVLVEKESTKYKDTKLFQFYFTTPDAVKIPLYYACSVLGKDNDDVEHERPSSLQFKGDLREYQIDITKRIIEKLSEYRGATLIASTGAGKTIIGAWMACHLKCYTVILIEKVGLIVQWKETIETFTNAKVWVVGEDSEPEPDTFPEFIICMKERAKKVPEKIRKEVGLVVIDEAHKFCTKRSIETLLYFSPIYTLSLTATPNRADGAQKIIHQISGNEYVTYSEKKNIQVITIGTGLKFGRPITKRGDIDWNAIDNELHYHPMRNQLLLDLLVFCRDEKVLVLTRRKDHVRMLDKVLTHYGFEHDTMFGDKSSYNDSPILIGTGNKIGEGFDEAVFCSNFKGKRINVVIIFNSYKSVTQLQQNIGRSRDKFPIIYHFVDDDSITYKHWLNLRKYYTDKENPSEITFQRLKEKDIKVDDESRIYWPYDSEGVWILNDDSDEKGKEPAVE